MKVVGNSVIRRKPLEYSYSNQIQYFGYSAEVNGRK